MPDYYDFPKGALLALQLTERQMARDPEYLDRAECPHDDALKNWLRARLGPKKEEPAAAEVELEPFDANDPASAAEVGAKTMQLYQRLELLVAGSDKLDTTEQIQVIKTQTALLERLDKILDRANGFKEVAEFKRTMFELIDSLMTPDQRTALIEKLKAHI